MGKKKKQRKKITTKVAKNKRAFDEIVGDPFAFPEPIDGHYSTLKNRSSISIIEPERQTQTTVNPAKPNPLDFFCDVESAIDDGLNTYDKHIENIGMDRLKLLFDNTYIFVNDDMFSQVARAKLEQIIGNILIRRGISPVHKYFTTIRK